MAAPSRLDSVITLAQHRGFVFPSGEIYGGTRSAWDYGPLGVELKENIKREWWNAFVRGRGDMVGLDSAIILPHRSLGGLRSRPGLQRPADRVADHPQALPRRPPVRGLRGRARPPAGERPGRHRRPRPPGQGGPVDADPTVLGPPEDLPRASSTTSPACTTCVQRRRRASSPTSPTCCRPSRKKPPFGIGQIGKAFRNEITPGNFIFRTREFEQMEIEFFVEPGTDEEWFQTWIDLCWDWFVDLGIDPQNIRRFEHPERQARALLEAHHRHRVQVRLRRQASGAS